MKKGKSPLDTNDARTLLKAMEVMEVANAFDESKVEGVVLTARTADQRLGQNRRPVSVMIDKTHPSFATVLGLVTGAVSTNKTAAEATIDTLKPVLSEVGTLGSDAVETVATV